MQNLRINNIKPIQEDFWGNGAVYHGYAGMPDDCGRVYNEEQCILQLRLLTVRLTPIFQSAEKVFHSTIIHTVIFARHTLSNVMFGE